MLMVAISDQSGQGQKQASLPANVDQPKQTVAAAVARQHSSSTDNSNNSDSSHSSCNGSGLLACLTTALKVGLFECQHGIPADMARCAAAWYHHHNAWQLA